MLRDIDAVVAATAERRVVLFGFYNSCTHAIAWAARHPDRVAGLVLHREGSPVVPRSATDDLVAAIPDARLVVLPGASPTLFFEDATTVLRLLVSFVSDPSASLPAVAAPARRRTDALRAVAASAAQAGWPSPRELEVLRLIARGDSNAEIAAQLGLSINTVERHLANVYRKIDARGRADATAWAIRNGVA